MRKHVEESVAPGAAAGGGRGGRLSAGRKRETDSCAGSSSDRCLRFLEKPGPSQPRSVRFAFREPKTSESRIPSHMPSHTWFGRLPRRGHAPRGCGLGVSASRYPAFVIGRSRSSTSPSKGSPYGCDTRKNQSPTPPQRVTLSGQLTLLAPSQLGQIHRAGR